MKVTLLVGEVEMTFTEAELTAILEEHFNKAKTTQEEGKPIQRPTEGIPFEVNPLGIDRSLFQKKRKDSNQEETRQLILEAFAQVDENPQKYGKPFKTLMPKKTWVWKNVNELRKLATNLGDHMADRTEQALEWAQRIANGEAWEEVCNMADNANWLRLIDWKNGYTKLVGGSRKVDDGSPASYVYNYNFNFNLINNTVPLVVLYK